MVGQRNSPAGQSTGPGAAKLTPAWRLEQVVRLLGDELALAFGSELSLKLPGLAIRIQHFASPMERIRRNLGEDPADR